MDFVREDDPRKDVMTWRNFAYASAFHVTIFLLFWISSCVFAPNPETVIPIDLTVVPPWAEQTDDPDPDPNPPPKDEPKPEPKPEPEPEPKPAEEKKLDAVELEKPREKPKEKPKPIDLRKNAKLVTTPVKPLDLREKAKKIDAPVNMRPGKATANDKPLSAEEFQRLMNQGYRIGARNQLAANDEQLGVSMIARAIKREWDKESFSWNPGLTPLEVQLSLGAGGRVTGFRIIRGCGDAEVDRTARAALGRLRVVPGLTAAFLAKYAIINVYMEPRGS